MSFAFSATSKGLWNKRDAVETLKEKIGENLNKFAWNLPIKNILNIAPEKRPS